MKKISAILVLLIVFTAITAKAGDIPESLMSGDQKALFIGQITAVNEETYTIMPSTVMMGSIKQPQIETQKFAHYYGTDVRPKIDDFMVAVLLDDNKIDDTWVFKCTCDDYKTLKLVSKAYSMVRRYERYINDGTYFEAQKEIDNIYKKPKASPEGTVDAVMNAKNSQITPEESEKSKQNEASLKSGVILIGTICTICAGGAGILTFIVVRKRGH